MYTIQSTKHKLYTNKINKIALSGDDDCHRFSSCF